METIGLPFPRRISVQASFASLMFGISLTICGLALADGGDQNVTIHIAFIREGNI